MLPNYQSYFETVDKQNELISPEENIDLQKPTVSKTYIGVYNGKFGVLKQKVNLKYKK